VPRADKLAAIACRSRPASLGHNFVVMKTSDLAMPLSRKARPMSASLRYMVAVSMRR
jgi:hypothetical protein